MEAFFKTTTRQKPNGKWATGYIKTIKSGSNLNQQPFDWGNEFNSKEEAEEYATGFCLKQGLIPVNKK